jgi:amino acid transporter
LWFRRTIGRTNDGNTPITAILICSFLGLLSLVGLSNDKYGQPRLTLSAFFTAITACIYIAECISFLRFKAGLDRLQSVGIFGRKDTNYKRYLFKSRWQPLPAYIGIVGCTIVVIFSGFPALFILGAEPKNSTTLKDKTALLLDLVGAWFGVSDHYSADFELLTFQLQPFLFGIFFLSYKYGYPKSTAVKVSDLTLSKYILQDPRIFELQDRNGAVDPNAGVAEHDGRAADEGNSRDQQEFITSALSSRRQRPWRGFWREMWGFVALEEQDRQEQRRYRRENRSLCCGGDVED